MINKIFLFLFLTGCPDYGKFIEATNQPSYAMFCWPSESSNTSIYVSPYFNGEMFNAVTIKAEKTNYIINLNENNSGHLEGSIDLPFFNCKEIVDIKFGVTP